MRIQYYRIPAKNVEFDLVSLSDHKVHIFVKNDEVNTNNKSFLAKMMSAIGVDFETEIKITNNDWLKKVTFRNLILHQKPLYILIFGLKPEDMGLGFQIPVYRYFMLNQHKILCVDNLLTIQNNKNKKLQLWNELKFMFNLT